MTKYLILLLLLSNLRECLGAVVRGARAQDGQFPWLIQFHTIIPCGGVLISPDWVLTAAQCVEYNRHSIELYGSGLNGTGTSQTISVKATYMFPEFRAYSKNRDYDHNIALLKLVRAFDMCDGKVRLLDIAPMRLDDDYTSCLIFGWQSTVSPTSKVHAKPVRYSKVLLNSWRVCMYMHEGNASYKNVFCTMIEDKQGVRACAGNPGSPVVCEDRYKRMVLLGIASWSNFSLDCGGLPTYLEVSVFRSWMWDLISGNKNMDQRETGIENRAGICQKERPIGGIYGESHLHPQIQNHTEVEDFSNKKQIYREDDEEDDAYAISEKLYRGRIDRGPKISTKRISGAAKIHNLRGKIEPADFDEFDDYSSILDANGPRKSGDFDVLRERDERLSQYREIGKSRNDGIEEPIAVPSQQEKQTIVAEKPVKKIRRLEEESSDDLELIMLDGIEDSDRSSAVTFILYYYSLRNLLICFWSIFNTIT